MKISITSFIVTLALALGVQAGTSSSYSGGKQPVSKNPVMPEPVPVGCDCFAPGGALSIFAAGFLPDVGDEEMGGGIGVEQFFTENLGVALAATWFAADSEIHNYTADLVVRLPLGDSCIAPYILGGGGVHTNGSTEAIGRLGAGVDIRIPSANCAGIFADWVHTFEGGDIDDYSIVRLGAKIPF